MRLRLEPLERAKTYELVVRQLKAEIFAGRLRPGDRLPGERQLCEILQASRSSVREALRILEAMEIVRSAPGSGPTSGGIIAAKPSRALSDLLGIHVALSSYSVKDVLRVRTVLEVEAVRQLARSVKNVDTSGVRAALNELTRPDLGRQVFHELDTNFHLELARCSSNTLLADLMAALKEAVRRPMAAAFEGDHDWPARSKVLIDEHREIYRAVEAGEEFLAADLMRNHIEGFYSSLSDSPDAGCP